MPDSTVLVERLVAADDECKRYRLEVARLQVALDHAEQDAASLRGSCRALGEELKQTRSRLTASNRALSWLMHNRIIEVIGMPNWLIRTLKGRLRQDQ